MNRLPHRGLARLILRTEEVGAQAGRCIARIPAQHPAVEDGFAPASVLLELGAQAAAALACGADAAPTAPGRIVSLRDTRFLVPRLPADQELVVLVRLVEEAPPLRIYAFEVPGAGAGRVGVFGG